MASLTCILILSIILPFIIIIHASVTNCIFQLPKQIGENRQATKDFNYVNPEIQGTESILLFKRKCSIYHLKRKNLKKKKEKGKDYFKDYFKLF